MLKRRLVLFVPALAPVAVIVLSLLLADRLPDPLASHWDASGEPDGTVGLWPLTTGVAAAVLAAWALLMRQARVRGRLRLTVAPFSWAAATFVATLHVSTLLANLDAASWRAAELPLWWVLVTLATAVAAGFAAHALERGRPVAPATPPRDAATIGLRPGEQAVWSARVQSRWALVAAAALAAGLVLVAVLSGPWWLAVVGPLAGLVTASLSEIVATADRRGLTIAYGPLGWPRQTVPLEQIDSVESIDIDPWRVGGWGYRKVPRRPGVTAIVIRAGEGIRVRRRDGRELLVTVPDATTAAGLLNDIKGLTP
jgi:hypothetical protein